MSDLGPLSGLAALTSLDLGGSRGLSDLSPLSGLAALTALKLSGCVGVSDLGPLSAGCPDRPGLGGCVGVSDLGPLSGLAYLTSLDLRNCVRGDLSPLSGLVAKDLPEPAALRARARPRSAVGPGRPDLPGLGGCRGLSDLAPLSGLAALTSLDQEGIVRAPNHSSVYAPCLIPLEETSPSSGFLPRFAH